MRCCGCRGVGRHKDKVFDPQVDDQEPLLDLAVAASSTTQISLCIGIPRSLRGQCASRRLPLRSRSAPSAPLVLTLAVLGGPDGDIFGGRGERIAVPAGCRSLVHEITGLQPDTEYTVLVSCPTTGAAAPDSAAAAAAVPAVAGRVVLVQGAVEMAGGGQRLEVRTAAPEPAWVAEKAGGSGDDAAELKGNSAGKGNSLAKGGRGIAIAGGGASSSRDDASTAASSRRDDDGPAQTEDFEWDSGSEADGQHSARTSPLSSRQRTPHSAERDDLLRLPDCTLVEEPPVLSVQCSLLSFFDCFSQRSVLGAVGPQADVAEILVTSHGSLGSQQLPPPPPRSSQPRQATLADLLEQSPARRAFRGYRMPFPGVPLDAAAHGLYQLERSNEALMADRLSALAAGGSCPPPPRL
mmetsp:Transcript_51597/g.167573  ORF Transcript_51597/g.167573 Transcript_51597/m.167573 type:complete len:409 (+) Transcript_51597:117-1343(+)